MTILIRDTKHLLKILNAVRNIETVKLVTRHLESDCNNKPIDVEIEE